MIVKGASKNSEAKVMAVDVHMLMSFKGSVPAFAQLAISLCFFLIWLAPVTLRAEQVIGLWEQYISEGIPAQQEFRRQLAKGASVLVSEEIFANTENGLELLSNSLISCTLQSPSLAVEQGRDQASITNGGTYVLAASPHYGFRLDREETNRSWLIRDLEVKSPLQLFYKNVNGNAGTWSVDEILLLDILPVLELGGVPIERLLQAPTTSIRNASLDVDRFRIDFLIKPDESQTFQMTGGSVWLLPKHSWVISEFEVLDQVVRPSAPIEYRISHRQFEWATIDNMFLPVRISWKTKSKSDARTLVEGQRIYSDWKIGPDLNTNRFSLSYYGLPEPGTINSSDKPASSGLVSWLVVINIVGVSLLCGGMLVRYLAGRTAD